MKQKKDGDPSPAVPAVDRVEGWRVDTGQPSDAPGSVQREREREREREIEKERERERGDVF